MRILIVGDVLGAGAEAAPPIDQRPIVPVSVDTFDDVFARFKPSVALPALGLQAPLAFETLDDFHPDRLFDKVEIFGRFRTLRHRLQNPSTFEAAVYELRSDAPALLGTKSDLPFTSGESNRSRREAGVDAFIRSLVAPHIVAGNDPQLPQFLSAVDAAITDKMRSLLHDAAFQRLEATWRGVRWLLANTGEIEEEDLEVSVLHLTRDELSANAHPDSALERRLESRGADRAPWSLVVADFAFGPSEGHMETLRGLGRLLSGLGVPLVAAANGALAGTELSAEVARIWADVRAMPGGQFLGLTWPRIILRLPYGRKTDPIDGFAFEEMPTDHAHEDYLWGNGAFAAALALVRRQLGESGGFDGDIGDLPAFTYMEHGEPTLKPCAEFCMTERAAAEVLARGIIPLVSYRNRNAVRLIGVESIGGTAIG